MATAGLPSRKGFVGVAATSSGTSAEIGEVQNAELAITHRPIDATSYDSSGWDEFIDGMRGATLTLGAVYARTEAEQLALRKTLGSTGVTSRHWTFRPSTAQNQLWRGQGYLETIGTVFGDVNTVIVTNMQVRITRAVTFTS